MGIHVAKFTVRVELHGGESEDYDVLHEQMEIKGFSRTITNAQGVEYHLPTAEYVISTNLTLRDVATLASEAASGTGLDHSVLVTKSSGRFFLNLTPVESQESEDDDL